MPATVNTCRVGINGFGRIGRTAFRASLDREDLEVVAINHTAPSVSYLLHSIIHDSTHGHCRHTKDLSISPSGNLIFRDREITLFSERDPTKLDWATVDAEYIVESTGKMTTVELAERHVTHAGAKKVVISSPSKDAKTIVVGVNRREYDPSMTVVSNASCTTNCLAPLAKILDKEYIIESGMMTTIHASTSSQHILDGYSKKSRRLGRAVGSNMIPTTTGAATAVALVLPNLAGKFTGISVRVPVNNVSLVDLTVTFKTPVVSKEALLAPIREQAAGKLAHIITVDDDELVSSDFVGWQQSCIVDSAATTMLNPLTWKICAWYDNETGYSVRCLDLIKWMYDADNNPDLLSK